MISEINRIKQNPILKKEAEFFREYKETFTQSISVYLDSQDEIKHSLENNYIADTFYEALFYPQNDFFDKHLFWMNTSKDINIGFFFSSLLFDLIESYINYKKDENIKKHNELIQICAGFQKNIYSALQNSDEVNFDISPYMPKDDGITYLHNMYKLNRGIRFITHTESGTNSDINFINQIGQHSAVIHVNDEQMNMIIGQHSSFILKSSDDEKNFSVDSQVLCVEDKSVIIKNLIELEKNPLLSRKYPRAAIVHTSLVHIANEDEYITGNMLDISEGGMGIMSSTKSKFEKGQNIVAFISYEDKDSGFKFSFEANGVITSVIGIEHVFRYGIQLSLNAEEKEIVRNLVDVLDVKSKK